MTWRDWLNGLLGRLFRPVVPDPPTPRIKPSVGPSPAVAVQLLEAHNAERKAHGLPPLRLDSRLVKVAQDHADWMAAHGTLTHNGADGDPWSRIRAAGYSFSNASENVGQGERSVPEVMAAWMSSSGHRANVLGDYVHFGGSVTIGNGGPWWTCCFATPA